MSLPRSRALLCLLLAALGVAAPAHAATRRLAVVVGANEGSGERAARRTLSLIHI